jgi:hypothetical protein
MQPSLFPHPTPPSPVASHKVTWPHLVFFCPRIGILGCSHKQTSVLDSLFGFQTGPPTPTRNPPEIPFPFRICTSMHQQIFNMKRRGNHRKATRRKQSKPANRIKKKKKERGHAWGGSKGNFGVRFFFLLEKPHTTRPSPLFFSPPKRRKATTNHQPNWTREYPSHGTPTSLVPRTNGRFLFLKRLQ